MIISEFIFLSSHNIDNFFTLAYKLRLKELREEHLGDGRMVLTPTITIAKRFNKSIDVWVFGKKVQNIKNDKIIPFLLKEILSKHNKP